MVAEFIVNKHSKAQLDQVAKRMHQSILISGDSGLGLLDAAKYFSSKISANLTEVKPINRATEKIDMENGKILVPLIRDLYESTRTKSNRPRVVVVHAAHTMTPAAQGAFLKLLEEPYANIHFILLSEHPSQLLPTILSRVARVHLRKISTEQSEQLLKELGVNGTKERQQMLFMADGLALSLKKLATDNEYFLSQATLMAAAKDLIQADAYDKLVAINKYRSNRNEAIELVDKALLIVKKTLSGQPGERLIEQLDSLIDAKQQLQSNGNVRLSLMRCIL